MAWNGAIISIFFSSIVISQQVVGRTLTQDEWNTLQAAYVLPNSTIFFHALVFTICLLLLLYPPDAFMGAGLSFDNLTYGYLGSSEANILEFHCRRVVLTRSLVASSPYSLLIQLSVLVLSLYFAEEYAVLFTSHPTRVIHYFTLISPFFALGGLAYLIYHTMTGFRSLTAMKILKDYGYDSPARLHDSFKRIQSNVSKLIITDSWLFHCSRFNFVVVKVSDAHFRVIRAEDTMNMLHHALGMNQYLTVAVSLPTHFQHLNFQFKINNVSMRDLERKLGTNRIEFSQEVQLKMSLTDMFIEAFLDQAKKNPRFHQYIKEELEPCLGCSDKLSNIKLSMGCNEIMRDPEQDEFRTDCSPCHCRPMWCVSCMARIFLAKQNQSRSTVWLEGTCPCPTCRATFCVMDVSLLSFFDDENLTDATIVRNEGKQ
ncbi:hypothetical protein DICVIV_12930 [Dictyocaulus viviparus]|uniref:Transmembrane protein 129 n=1 Tax=Dictyocaulus viviparus TaxID=29172 RepID=A0A0D8X937_DICVI|nr:hypothetical protein DICVIV_12930 [Dictyocaulus viviparus]